MINRRTLSRAVGLGTGAAAVSPTGLQTGAFAAAQADGPAERAPVDHVLPSVLCIR